MVVERSFMKVAVDHHGAGVPIIECENVLALVVAFEPAD
jgi:hypothetical protein